MSTAPPECSTPLSSPLEDRGAAGLTVPPHQRELEKLRQIHGEMLRAHVGRAVILHGSMGFVTEQLLIEWKQELYRQRDAVFEADCLPGSNAYAPLAEIVSRHIRAVENLGLLDEQSRTLVGIVGPSLGLARSLPVDPQRLASLPREGDRIRFFEQLGQLWSNLTAKLPATVILKNLHLADTATRDAVIYLIRNVITDPVEAIAPAGFKTTGFTGVLAVSLCDSASLIEVLRRDLGASQGTLFIDLDHASEESVRQFLASPPVLRRFLDSTGGDAGELQALLEAIPDNIEDLYVKRCEGLSPLEMDLLGAMAVAGKPMAPEQLLRLFEFELPVSVLSDLLKKRVISKRVLHGQLLVDLPSQGNRRAVYGRLSPARQSHWHERYATWLTDRARYGEPADPAELSHHYLRSGHRVKAVEHALLAAEKLHMTHAYEEASDLLESVLPVVATSRERQTILERLIDLAACRQEHRLALRYCGQLQKERPSSERAWLYRRIAEMCLALGSYSTSLRLLNKAREAIRHLGGEEERQDEEIRVDSLLAETCYGQARYDDVVAVCESGLARTSSSPRAEAQRQAIHLGNTLGKVYLHQEDYERAAERFRSNLEQAEEHHWPEEAIRARFNLGTVALQQRAYPEAESLFMACLGAGDGLVNPLIRAFIEMNLAVAYHKTNRFSQALGAYLRSLATFSKSGNELQYAVVSMNLGALYHVLGDASRARGLVEASLAAMCARHMRYYEGWARYVMAGIEIGEGRLDDAGDALDTALDIMRQHGGSTWVRRIQVRQCRLQLERGGARQCMAGLETLTASGPTREDKEIEAEALHLLGRCHLAIGDAEAAVTTLLRAKGLCEEVEALDRLVGVEALLAESNLVLGRAAQGRKQLETAAALIRQLAEGLTPPLQEIFVNTPERRRVLRLSDEMRSTQGKPNRTAKQIPLPSGIQLATWRARYGRIVGEDHKLLQVFRMIDKVANSESTVLIQGESGTGKELIAEAIHQNSNRQDKPFVKVNCAAFVENLLLSELFGHEKGAFTGALARKKGRFELAQGGTLFLDEIGDISQNTQIALLRVLQERTFERVGGGEPIEVDVRVIVASNRNLEEMVRRQTFRLDLYYRLKGVIIELPPLRTRRGDIARLLRTFAERFQPPGRSQNFSREALEYLTRYCWPGNVRELENFTRSITLFVDEPVIELHHVLEFEEFFDDGEMVEELEPEVLFAIAQGDRADRLSEPGAQDASVLLEPAAPADEAGEGVSLGNAMMSWAKSEGLGLPELRRWMELEYIKQALIEARGNITRAAKLLDMKRPRLSQIINATPELAALKGKLTSA